MKDARIVLENEYNTYYAGQTLNGRIEYEFESPKKVRGIYVRFKGEANTSWTETKEEQTSTQSDQAQYETRDTMHSGHEDYFNITYYVLGSAEGSEIEIPAGKHDYNFTCTLPPVLPSSFESQFGYVRYTIKVTIDRPWNFDHHTKLAFTVVNPLDLNLNNSYKEPIHMQMEKTFCCLWCASAPLTLDVRAPVSGYCPGQIIPINVDIENKSNVQVHLVQVALRRVVTYRCTTPTTATKIAREVVVEIQEGPVPAGSSKHWDMRLEIPSIPPSNLVNCGIIDLDYDLNVVCKVSGIHQNMTGKKYVTIGTVPLVGQLPLPTAPAPPPRPVHDDPAVLPVSPGRPTDSYGGGETAGWTVPGAPPPYQSLYPTLTQPVYKVSPYTARTIQDREDRSQQVAGPTSFAPCYPTYAAVQPPPLPQ